MFKNRGIFFFLIIFMINSYYQISIYIDKSNKYKKKNDNWKYFRVKTFDNRTNKFLSKKKIKNFRKLRNSKEKELKINKRKLKRIRKKMKEFKEFLQKH